MAPPFTGLAGIRAMKPGDFQASIFPGTQAGLQAALDYCNSPGGIVRVGPTNLTGMTNLTMYGWTTLEGCGPHNTLLTRSAGATGTFLREKTAAEGNPYGASGIIVKDIGFSANGSTGDCIDFGNQGGAQFTSNAYLSDILVSSFASGTGIKLNANAIHMRDVWVFSCQDGLYLAGGANHVSGLWTESNSGTQLKVVCPWNTFEHVQIEQTGAAPSGPLIDLSTSSADRNVFAGVYMSFAVNLTNLIICRTGVIGTQFYGIRVNQNGHTWTNTIYTEGTATGTGAVDWIGFFNDMSSSGKHFMNDQTLGEAATWTGARPSFPQATIGTLNVSGTSALIGNLTLGVAGVGAGATIGQGTTGTDSATITARSGNGAGAVAQFLLNRNGTNEAGFRAAAGQTFLDTIGNLTFRNGISGPTYMAYGPGGAIIPPERTLTDAATIAVDASAGSYFKVTLGGNRTMGLPSSATTDEMLYFRIIQDGTGGRTLLWNAAFKHAWSDTGNTAGKVSTIAFKYDGANWYQHGAQSPYV